MLIVVAVALSFAFGFAVGYGTMMERRLHAVVSSIREFHRQRKKEQAFMSEARDALTTLESKITDAETIKEGVITLVEGLVAEVQKLAASTADAPTAKELLALANRVQAMTTNYSDAVVANTPAAAPPAPVTPPDPAPTQPVIPPTDPNAAGGNSPTT